MKISENLIVIPARYNSSRLPKKILADIHGYPMIYWVAKRLEKANQREKR
jgi:3-deoxy-manno-octulosonate cytidylyltransferase (CMP-KDO synthetase)